MARKISVKFQLTQDEVAYIERYQDTRHLSSRSAALEFLLDEHRHKNDIPATEYLAGHLAETLGALLLPELKKLRLGVNHTDQNAQINTLLLNTLLGYSGMQTLTTRDTPQLRDARQEIKKILSHQQNQSAGWRNK